MAAKAARQSCSDHAIHVARNDRLDRWDVLDSEGRLIGHCYRPDEALGLAIEAAQHAHASGTDTVVCIEQPDGGYRLAWSSP
jgi:hypothetical protein